IATRTSRTERGKNYSPSNKQAVESSTAQRSAARTDRYWPNLDTVDPSTAPAAAVVAAAATATIAAVTRFVSVALVATLHGEALPTCQRAVRCCCCCDCCGCFCRCCVTGCGEVSDGTRSGVFFVW